MKHKLYISFIINIVLLVALIIVLFQTNSFAGMKTQMGKKNTTTQSDVLRPAHYEQRQTLFERLPITNNSIVMLGDSMILYNEWSEEFPIGPILNRGIGGDTTFGLLKRLGTITKGHPKCIIIMIGVNDIAKGIAKDQTLKNYNEILSKIEKDSPNSKVIITSILPVNNKLYGYRVHNSQVIQLNKSLQKLASGHHIQMVNIHDQYLKGNQLDSKYTRDGLHLNGEGYNIWINALKPYLSK